MSYAKFCYVMHELMLGEHMVSWKVMFFSIGSCLSWLHEVFLGSMLGNFFQKLSDRSDLALNDFKYCIFGLGDSHYWGKGTEESKFNFAKPARDLDNLLEKMGAQRMMPTGWVGCFAPVMDPSKTHCSILSYAFLACPACPQISQIFYDRPQDLEMTKMWTSTTPDLLNGRASFSPVLVLTRQMQLEAVMMAL